MKKKWIKKTGIILGGLIALGSSVKVEKLDEVLARAEEGEFDAEVYAKDYWNNELLPNLYDSSVEANRLIRLLEEDPEKAFDQYSKAFGIGNIRFFMVRGEGEIIEVGEDDITVLIESDLKDQIIRIETEYIFGNAVRDASGGVDLQDFEQTMDFNNVSAEINQLIREEVLPEINTYAQEGRQISFVGAAELNRERVDLDNLEVIPVSIEFSGVQKE